MTMQDVDENSSKEEEDIPPPRRSTKGKELAIDPVVGPAPRPMTTPANYTNEPVFANFDNHLQLQKSLKVALPDKFHGDRKELETFLLQLGIYY
jgi:hypothetical protein